jgi:Putative peptidoglycan binding domain
MAVRFSHPSEADRLEDRRVWIYLWFVRKDLIMKTKLLLLLGLLLLAFADVSQADRDDGRRWRGRGDWDDGQRWRGRGDWDDGRRWRGRGDWDDGRRWRGRGDWDDGRRWRGRGDWDDGRRWRGRAYWRGGPYWRGPYWRGGYWRGGPYWRGGWGPWFGVGVAVPGVRIALPLPVPAFGAVYAPAPRPAPYVTYARPMVASAQERLARLGYYPGPIDGDFGPITSRAIRSYQMDYGLPVTGRLDSRTRASLGM